MMLRTSIAHVQLLLLLVVSATAATANTKLSKARRLRQKLTFTNPSRRRAQDNSSGGGSSAAASASIFAIGLEEFQQILSTDLLEEYGVEELGVEKATELWENSANYQLDLAVEAEERYLDGDDAYGTEDAEYPYLICSRKPRKSALARLGQIVDIAVLGAEDESFNESKLFTIYNDNDMSCFGARFLASTALVIADLQDPELPLLPLGANLKVREGAVEEALRRAGIEIDPDVPIDEFVFRQNDSVSSSETRIEVALCSGQDRDSLDRMGVRLLDFMNLLDPDDPSQSVVAKQNIYADLTDDELDNMPARSKFWRRVFEMGIDSADGCQDTFDGMIFEGQMGDDDGEVIGFYASFGEQTADTNLTTAVSCALSIIAGISLLPQVCSVDLNPLISTNNVDATWILQDAADVNTPFYDKGITGKGEVIGVSDSGLDTDNCYVWDATGDIRKNGVVDESRRKIIQYDDYIDDQDDPSGHGTHVVGTIVGHRAVDGRAESDGLANGIARDAKVAFIDCGAGGDSLYIPADTGRYLGIGTPAGAKIHSSSWGSDLIPPKYDSLSRDTDAYLYNDWNFLQIVAAGNSGTGNREKSIGSPAVAKNVLTVGASQNPTNKGIGYLADFSSRGPTSDGRISPDVVAPGQSILSMNAVPSEVGECDPDSEPLSFSSGVGQSDGVQYLQGTSMATPAVSGAAALVRQYFKDGFFPTGESIDPSGMLLKAVLISGAQQLSLIDNGFTSTPTAFYDNNQGFGRVSLIDSLPLEGANLINASYADRAIIRDGETIDFEVNITHAGGCKENDFRATLVWADPPGASGCVKCLVNDLDLTVTNNGDGKVYYPNGRRNKDSINNVERIIADASDGDTMLITIEAANLDRAEQPFALYLTGCFGSQAFSGDAAPQGQPMDSKTKITIIACSVFGFLLILLIVCWVCDKRRQKKRRGARKAQPNPRNKPAQDNNEHHGATGRY